MIATITPTTPEELIKLTAETPWGVTKTTQLGINGIKCPKVIADGILAATIETASGANLDTINSNLEWKLVGSVTGNSTAITLPDGWKELIVVANANNSTAALGSWHFIAKTISTAPCRFTQGTNTSWITIWLSKTKAQIYQGFINGVDYASTSTMVVYYR